MVNIRAYDFYKVAAGDYLLPSNNGRIVFRIVKRKPADGKGFPRWALYQWKNRVRDGDLREHHLVEASFDDWDKFALVEVDTFESRDAAARKALLH